MTRATRYLNSIRQERNAWSEQFEHCMNCQRHYSKLWLPLQTHEIERRSHAANNWAQEVNYLRLCQECHDTVGRWPHAKQLALKWLRDPTHETLEAMLAAWRDVGGRCRTYVTAEEVQRYLEEMT